MKVTQNKSIMTNNTLTLTKKYVILVCTIGMALVFALIGCDGSGGDGGGGDTAEIVCFGDSLTAGRSATTVDVDDASNSYPAFLQDLVTVTVANAGVSGDTTADALARVQNVISKDPAIVVICLGANDVLTDAASNNLSHTVSTMGNNLQDILDALDTDGRIIFVAKFYSSANADSMLQQMEVSDSTERSNLITECDTMFSGLTTANADLVLISDIWTGVWGTYMSSDGIHPTAAGYEVMADLYFNAMQSELSSRGWIK